MASYANWCGGAAEGTAALPAPSSPSTPRLGESARTRHFKNVAIECNNVGVRLHRKNRHDLAMHAFCDAVHVMKSTPCPDEKTGASTGGNGSGGGSGLVYELEMILASNYRRLEESCRIGGSAASSSSSAAESSTAVVDGRIHGEEAGRGGGGGGGALRPSRRTAAARPKGRPEESAIMIYSEPIMIDGPDSCRNAEMTGTIIFNMALSHHLYAVQHGDRPCMDKAMALYEMAHVAASSVLKTGDDSSSSADLGGGTTAKTPQVLAVIMGSLNNLGQIHYVLRQLQATLVYFDEMSRVYSEHGCDGGPPGSWSGFWTNLFLFDCPHSAPAA